MSDDGLPSGFHPLIRSWFRKKYGSPTAVQAEAWPLIAEGAHVLAIAPTGSGKTLTAFLACLSRFACGAWPADVLSVLYVSPLKALNEDIGRNLREPLQALRAEFEGAGLSFPGVRVETRSGDTPQAERRRFLNHPPSILALTPESLAILLLNPRGRQVLSTVRYLILDEIHAVLGNKRGSFLSCQVDRLSLAAGEFQRVGLSATVHPPERAAEFLGGLMRVEDGREHFDKRAVRIVNPPAEKKIEFLVDFPKDEEAAENSGIGGPDTAPLPPRYRVLVDYILGRIHSAAADPGDSSGSAAGPERRCSRSTILVFTGSRRRAERLSFFLNRSAGKPVACAHHGSLSKELRRSVEQRLAEGSIPCVAATASLELGIDIGAVDEVILAGSPGSVAQTLQRTGRSGHGVGKTSRAKLFPFHGMDLLAAAALESAVRDREIEELRPVENPLDVLAQIILALCAEKRRNIDELYGLLRGFYVFKDLDRASYEGVIRMLAGSGRGGRLRELKPRLYLDGITGDLAAAEGSLLLLYASGGIITSRGMYSLRLAGDGGPGTRIGELDEEFVWERRVGDCFEFGARYWRILSIGSEAVEAAPLESPVDFIPFWKADAVFCSPVLARRLLAILDRYEAECETVKGGAAGLFHGKGSTDGLSKDAAAALAAFLDSQRAAQGGVPLPGSAALTVEIVDGDASGTAGEFYPAVIHSFRGGAVNYPLALALAEELEEHLQSRVASYSDDYCILFLVPRRENGTGPEELFRRALDALDGKDGTGLSRGERLARRRLLSSGIFGTAFREAAERSLLLPRQGFGKRSPLWLMRQRSRQLFDAVLGEEGFPVTAEAWRSCLRDRFDMEGFRDLIAALHDGSITCSFFHSASPSPFSRDMIRQETNELMYEYDGRPDLRGPGTPLADRVVEEALGEAGRRPRLDAALTVDFTARLRREIPGWAPEDELALAEWVKERIAIPVDEWERLTAVLPPALGERLREDPGLGNRLKLLRRPGAALPSMVHREQEGAWEKEGIGLLGPWLRYEGPLSLRRVMEVFGAGRDETEAAVLALAEAEELVRDVSAGETAAETIPGGQTAPGTVPAGQAAVGDGLFCDRENLAMLLRLSRKKARPAVRERPAAILIPLLALRQGVAATAARRPVQPWKVLSCLAAPVRLWETEIFCARDAACGGETLDREIREGRLCWYGAGKERAGFCRPEDLELLGADGGDKPQGTPRLMGGKTGDRFFDRPRDFWEIKEAAGMDSRGCAEALWHDAWEGFLSADSWEPLRRGIERGFIPAEVEELAGTYRRDRAAGERGASPFGRMPRIPAALRRRWQSGAPVGGNWFSLLSGEGSKAAAEADPLYEEECNRDRVRLLAARWGVLCRPLLEREAPAFSWSRLLPTMRRMELAGELVTGRFFAGVNSLQFAPPRIISDLEEAEALGGIFWLNAADPASPAGLGAGGLDPRLPPRSAACHLCFRGSELAAVSSGGFRHVRIHVDPEDPELPDILSFLKVPRLRKVQPERKVCIETVNGEPAVSGGRASGGYIEALKTLGFTADRGRLILW
ncbi:MAG: DEAD/DEAH box helicase [Treponema sp.]|jgi:ATP-dependent Lhr-like helicase|nr:DEAD/DEAH box helicase [Treponema sp.]